MSGGSDNFNFEEQPNGSPGPPFPPVPGAGSSITLTAKGAISLGDPLMVAAGFPDHASVLAQTEAGVSAYIGWANTAALDGASVQVWIGGPCPLFAGLNTIPTPPDQLEYYVYGPHPPVLFSAIPAATFFRRCGTPLDATTLLLDRGEVEKTP